MRPPPGWRSPSGGRVSRPSTLCGSGRAYRPGEAIPENSGLSRIVDVLVRDDLQFRASAKERSPS